MVIRSPRLFITLLILTPPWTPRSLVRFEYARIGQLKIRAVLLPRITILEID